MIFTTYWFVAFAAIYFPLFWLVRAPAARLYLLLAASVLFHGHFAGAAGVLPIAVLGIITWLAGRSRNPSACLGAIVACVVALCFYKYAEFLSASVLGMLGVHVPAQGTAVRGWLPAAPPLGISFFAFEFVHYLYEVRHGREPIRSPVDFTLFSVFFPSLVAGPIKRYQDFLPSLHAGIRSVGTSDVAQGLGRVAVGYLKKVVVADNLTAWIDNQAPYFGQLPLSYRWAIFLAIGLRILFDFSGYTDLAIGFARMMGIRLPENFNWPYAATSIQQFWQRWHMSLSSWIRDYVYIPLGGSHHGPTRRVANGLLAFALCGLWHGAAWNFLLWGLYHGVGLAICANYRRVPVVGLCAGRLLDFARPLAWGATISFVWFGWLLFFYPVAQAWEMAALLVPVGDAIRLVERTLLP